MNAPTAAPPRPETVTSAKLPQNRGREPWELQDRLGRNKLIEKVINDFSGMGGNTTEDFQKYYALIKAMKNDGYECNAELEVLDEWARISGDIQGKNKLQLIQMLEEKNILLPGGAGLYPPVEPVPGLIERFMNWATGAKKE